MESGGLEVKEVYRLLRKFPKEEQYAMCDQLRRAAISITSNIAEGIGRASSKEKVHFLEISYGSLVENVGRPLSGLRNYFDRKDSSLTPNLKKIFSYCRNEQDIFIWSGWSR